MAPLPWSKSMGRQDKHGKQFVFNKGGSELQYSTVNNVSVDLNGWVNTRTLVRGVRVRWKKCDIGLKGKTSRVRVPVSLRVCTNPIGIFIRPGTGTYTEKTGQDRVTHSTQSWMIRSTPVEWQREGDFVRHPDNDSELGTGRPSPDRYGTDTIRIWYTKSGQIIFSRRYPITRFRVTYYYFT